MMRTPATWVLIAINIILFFVEEQAGGSTVPEVAVRFGAQYAPGLKQKEWYRFFTAMFLHFGPFHLVCNMWSLYNLGPTVELLFGPFFFLLIYLVSGLCGNLLTWAIDERTGKSSISAGASGAIFGLLGTMLVLAVLPALRGYFSLRGILFTLFINIIYGLRVRGVNLNAHIGGFLGGIIVSMLIILVMRR